MFSGGMNREHWSEMGKKGQRKGVFHNFYTVQVKLNFFGGEGEGRERGKGLHYREIASSYVLRI